MAKSRVKKKKSTNKVRKPSAPKAKKGGKTKRSPNPCWKGYRMVGHKMKDGKKVPNCVKIK
jgi:hypothetical protein